MACACEAAAADAVVVTATRSERNSYEVPAAIDRLDADVIRDARPQIDLAETLGRVPGVVVQNRRNYAQDLQVSSRGFGARTPFGVRGVRLYVDGIPATAPDGQGQTSHIDLPSADRIEVLRGPFSTLYGNASGGVIQVFTENGPDQPTLSPGFSAGSYGSQKLGLKYGATSGAARYVASVSRFDIDGYRDHSAAERELFNGKLRLALGDAGRLSVVLNAVSQPAQDPLGLTRAQVEQNRRQVDPVALQFDTRKTVRQHQAGGVYERALSASDTLRVAAYTGTRDVEQFLALSGAAITSSGGVVRLDRDYHGLGLRWTRLVSAGDAALTLTVGADYDGMDERRKGYVNDNGRAGALRRDEDDTVASTDVYAQAEWRLAPRWSAVAGVRHSRIAFESRDFFIVGANPDDSGKVRFRNTSPVAGLTYELAPSVNLYGNLGRGFETPTFAELAYRPGGATGLNLDLQPATSMHGEVGVKAFPGPEQRLNLAVFEARTRNEIVIDSSSGGRNIFKNAGRTGRRGAEASWTARLLETLDLHAALTLVDARYREHFTSGTPAVTVAAGRRIPGVAGRTLYGEAKWRPRAGPFSTALELWHSDRVYVNDANSEYAPAYASVNWRVSMEQQGRNWQLTEFFRIDNVLDRRHIGSVIVGDANGRYYEPAPGRNYTMGVSARLSF